MQKIQMGQIIRVTALGLPLRFTRRGEALEVERFGVNSPVDCLWRISRPKHRAFLKGKHGAQWGGAAFGGLKGETAPPDKATYP